MVTPPPAATHPARAVSCARVPPGRAAAHTPAWACAALPRHPAPASQTASWCVSQTASQSVSQLCKHKMELLCRHGHRHMSMAPEVSTTPQHVPPNPEFCLKLTRSRALVSVTATSCYLHPSPRQQLSQERSHTGSSSPTEHGHTSAHVQNGKAKHACTAAPPTSGLLVAPTTSTRSSLDDPTPSMQIRIWVLSRRLDSCSSAAGAHGSPHGTAGCWNQELGAGEIKSSHSCFGCIGCAIAGLYAQFASQYGSHGCNCTCLCAQMPCNQGGCLLDGPLHLAPTKAQEAAGQATGRAAAHLPCAWSGWSQSRQ